MAAYSSVLSPGPSFELSIFCVHIIYYDSLAFFAWIMYMTIFRVWWSACLGGFEFRYQGRSDSVKHVMYPKTIATSGYFITETIQLFYNQHTHKKILVTLYLSFIDFFSFTIKRKPYVEDLQWWKAQEPTTPRGHFGRGDGDGRCSWLKAEGCRRPPSLSRRPPGSSCRARPLEIKVQCFSVMFAATFFFLFI